MMIWGAPGTNMWENLKRSLLAVGMWGLVWIPGPVVAVGQPQVQQTENNQNGQKLPVGDQKLNSGEKQAFPLLLNVGDFIQVNVHQKGIDVVVRLIAPDGKTALEIDSPNGTDGPEQLVFLSEQKGRYQIEVESLDKQAPPGRYQLTVEGPRPATDQDRARVEISSLQAQKATLSQAGKYDEAIVPMQQALIISEKAFGPDDPNVAACLLELGELYRIKGNFEKAESLLLRARAILEKTPGPDDETTATCLSILAEVYRGKGDLVKVEPLLVRVLAIYEKVLGPEHIYVATILNNLAKLYLDQGKFEQAGDYFRRSLAIYEKTLGPEHQYIAICLTNLASLAHSKSEYGEAVRLLKQALAIFEKTLGPDHPTTAISRNNLAETYRELGDYTRIEPLYLQALASLEKSLGSDHPNIAFIQNNLGNLYQDRGDFTKAESFYLRSLAIREKALGPNHLDVAQSLNNLGALLRDRGDLVQTELLFQRALAIRRQALGPNHPLVAMNLNNLAALSRERNNFTQAEEYSQQALAIYEKNFDANHEGIAQSLGHLANIYKDQGRLDQAELCLKRALSIREKVFGPDHPLVANDLYQLANLYFSKKETARAEPLLLQSLAIREKALGLSHGDVGYSLYKLAQFYLFSGEYQKSLSYQIRGNETIERDLKINLLSGSERQKILYLKKTDSWSDKTLSLHLQYLFENQTAAKAAIEILLSRKGRALDAMTNTLATVRSRSNPETQALMDEYAGLISQLSIQNLRGPGNRTPQEYQALLQELEHQKEKLEIELSRRSNEFKVQTTPISFEAIQRHVPPHAALIEFGLYSPIDAKTQKPGPSRYAAYVVTGSRTAKEPVATQLHWVDLGEAAPIDQAILRFRQLLRIPVTSPRKNRNLVSVANQRPLQTVQSQARLVDQLIMRPVRRLLGTTTRLLISPDGNLNLIPFDALVDERGKYLVEKYEISFLTSGRDLLQFDAQTAPKSKPVIIAAPDFAAGKGPRVFEQQVKPLVSLPGTKKEAAAIQAEFPQAVVETSAFATEASLKRVSGPQFLHVATHGYFLENSSQEKTQPTRQIETEPRINFEEVKKANPLLRSMLFLAQANKGLSGEDDGVLTALEATGLDLSGTKLVVLSACDTGVGEIKTGDGVLGLRRAFVLAGAETQIMSLWAVSDTATRDLMIQYYKRLKKGEDRSTALRQVRLAFLKIPKWKHPFYWASFILSGKSGPLEETPSETQLK